jgi:signal transduction histidine kinase
MKTRPIRRRMLIAYIALYLAFFAASVRGLIEMDDVTDVRVMVGLLVFYLIMLVGEPFLITRHRLFLHIITALQTAIAILLVGAITDSDFFALLFIPPCTMCILNLPTKPALAWIGSINVLMIINLVWSFPVNEAIGYVIIYPTAIFLFTSLSYLAMQAEAAQSRSEALLADLQESNRKLQAYAAQVEELAAAAERNRLARELHDSVTQIIFGLTLSAQAARILLDRNPARAAAELDHVQALAQNALAEMRALIQQLHPRSKTEEGLLPALRRLAEERKTSDGLAVAVNVSGERRLPVKVEEELYRIAQEALTNITKHAHTNQAVVTLDMSDGNRVRLDIEDAGVGFDPAKTKTIPGHLGLTSISERVQALGGTVLIDSYPGRGTRLKVDISLEQEVEHA